MTQTITAYAFDELSPEAQEKALERMPFDDCEYTLSECVDSLKAFADRIGVRLDDWSVGDLQRSFTRFRLTDDVEELSGPRAFAWIENNVFGPLRQPWSLKAKGRKYTRPGQVPACPFTGVCFDEDILDVFRKYDRRETLKDTFNSIGDALSRVVESDIEYCNSEAGRRERAACEFDGTLFDEDGIVLR